MSDEFESGADAPAHAARPPSEPAPEPQTEAPPAVQPSGQLNVGLTNEPPPQTHTTQQRRFQETTTYYSDLFKLQVAKLLHWNGWKKITKDSPRDRSGNLNEDWMMTEHCHYFHTIDSNGKVQDYCQPVAQHVHKMKVVRDPANPDGLPIVTCEGPPLKWVITDKYGKRERILEPDPHDKHEHNCKYIKSNELTKAKMNSQAAIMMGGVTASQTSKAVFDDAGKKLPDLAVR